MSLFRTQVVDLHCISVLSNQRLNLPGLFLRTADEAQISFTVQYSAVSIQAWRRVPLGLQILSSSTSGQDLAALAGSCPEDQWPGIKTNGLQVEESRGWRTIRVLVRITHQVLVRQEHIELEVKDRKNLLSTLRFRVIDETEGQRLRLEELQAEQQQLWVQSGDRIYACNAVVEPDAALVPEFILSGADLHAALPACETRLAVSLVADNMRTLLTNTRIVLGHSPVRVRAGPIALKDCAPVRHPGLYRLVASIGERDLAAFPFQIAGKREWEEQVRVIVLVEAETTEGRVRRETGALSWDKHVAFYPTLRIQTAIPAPNTPVRCFSRIEIGEKVLRCDELLVRLSQSTVRVRLDRFGLSELGSEWRGKRVSLVLTAHLGDQQKAVRPVLILPVGDVANREGQLNQDSDKLALDEEAYAGILRSLAAKPKRVCGK